jgi:hypothetical protein
MHFVAVHYLLLLAAAVYYLGFHKSLSSVIKFLIVPTGHVCLFCIQCTFFVFTGMPGLRSWMAFFSVWNRNAVHMYNNVNIGYIRRSSPGYSFGIAVQKRNCKETKTSG